MVFTDQPSCPPSLGATLLSALLVRSRSTLGRGCPPGIFIGPASPPCLPLVVQLRTCATTRALTPANGHLRRQVSPFTSHCRLIVPPPTTRCARRSFVLANLNVVVGFRASPHARRLAATPRRIGFVILRTDRSLDCYSPPRLTTTQLPSATGPWHTRTRTFTVLTMRPHGRTSAGFPAGSPSPRLVAASAAYGRPACR